MLKFASEVSAVSHAASTLIQNSTDIYTSIDQLVLPVTDVKQTLIQAGLLGGQSLPSSLGILHLDQIHPVVSGNKLFKLLPFIQLAEQSQAKTLVSFGGRFSNHLHALAYLGQKLGYQTIAFVRGYKEQALTPMLEDAIAWGMTLEFVGNTEYKQRHHQRYWLDKISSQDALFIPEGGADFLDWPGNIKTSINTFREGAAASLQALIMRSNQANTVHDIDVLSTAVGSGGFISLLMQVAERSEVKPRLIAALALKNKMEIQQCLPNIKSVEVTLLDNFHCGGFAKINTPLVQLICAVYECTHVLLDPIYNGKQVFAMLDAANNGLLENQSVLMIHSGGLQGVRGLYDKMGRVYGKPLPFPVSL